MSPSTKLCLSNTWISYIQKRQSSLQVHGGALHCHNSSHQSFMHSVSSWRLLFAGHVSLRYILPADDIPNSFQVVRPDVFILQVISMLPHVNPQQWNKTYWKEGEKAKTINFNLNAASSQCNLDPMHPQLSFTTFISILQFLI